MIPKIVFFPTFTIVVKASPDTLCDQWFYEEGKDRRTKENKTNGSSGQMFAVVSSDCSPWHEFLNIITWDVWFVENPERNNSSQV